MLKYFLMISLIFPIQLESFYLPNCYVALEKLIFILENSKIHEKIAEQLELCGVLKKCTFPEPFQQENIAKSCELLEFQTSPLAKCYLKLKTQGFPVELFKISRKIVCGCGNFGKSEISDVIGFWCGSAARGQFLVGNADLLRQIYNC